MDQLKKEKTACKVYVRMHDGSRLIGFVFVSEYERLQDIMNDDRMFIPVYVDEQSAHSTVMLSKQYIQRIEEVREDLRPEDLYRRYDRRSGDDRRSGEERRSGGEEREYLLKSLETQFELDDAHYIALKKNLPSN